MTAILLSLVELQNVPGGVELFSTQLQRAFKDLRVVTAQEARENGFFPKSDFSPLKEPWIAKSVCDYVQSMKKEWNPEVVISNGMMGWKLDGKEMGCPVITQFHGGYAPYADYAIPKTSLEYYRTRFIYARYERLCGKKSAARASNSDFTQQLVQDYYGISSKSIPLGIDFESFQPVSKNRSRKKLGIPLDKTVALFVGRPSTVKGFDVIQSIPKQFADVLFVWITFPAVQSVEPNVRSVGPVPHHQLNEYYSAADVVLNPTRFEGFGYVSLEALSCNTPLIATATGALVEEKPPNAVLLKKPGVESYSKALDGFLQDPFAENSRKWVKERYPIDSFIQSYMDWRESGFSD